MGCHTLPTPAQPQQFLWLAIPEICPPGEGALWVMLVPLLALRLLMQCGWENAAQGLDGRDGRWPCGNIE